MQTRNVWQALIRPGYLLSPWPWRAVAYLLTGAVTGAAVLVGLVAVVAVGVPGHPVRGAAVQSAVRGQQAEGQPA
ncbi:hypothetical protein AB0L81_44060, partial [Streptomyces sp. NPDC052127]